MTSPKENVSELRINRQLYNDINAAETPYFALGKVREGTQEYACLFVRIAGRLPHTAPVIGFRHGSCRSGRSAFDIIQFSFAFNGQEFCALVNPNQKIARPVLQLLLETRQYFVLITGAGGAITAYKAVRQVRREQPGDMSHIYDATTTERQYHRVAAGFRDSLAEGSFLPWVGKSKIGYLDLSDRKTRVLNPACTLVQAELPLPG